MNLHDVLQDIYIMVKHMGFSAEYVDRMSPAERGMYKMYFDKEMEEQKKQQEKSKTRSHGPTIGGAPSVG